MAKPDVARGLFLNPASPTDAAEAYLGQRPRVSPIVVPGSSVLKPVNIRNGCNMFNLLVTEE